MNILFLSLSDYDTVYKRGLYSDLLRQFITRGHHVYLISPFERRQGGKNRIIQEKGSTIIKLRIWNMQKTNVFEKGISMLTIDRRFINGIKHYCADIQFDLILYTTPPISLINSVAYIKKRDNAKSYLLLKDIFPQNAVDLGMMNTEGIGKYIYRHFRKQEKRLYQISDYIGCMSQANVEYIISHNQEVDPKKVEVCPNSIDVQDMSCTDNERSELRGKYGIPSDKTVFVYGGNLGKPQGIGFLISCLRECEELEDVFFLVVGNGTEYPKLEDFCKTQNPHNVKLMQRMPREDYDRMIGSCDIGLIFLDYRFSIPNFPSRLLNYMAAKLPVLVCTDSATDIGKIVEEGGFGWSCESNSSKVFKETVLKAAGCQTKDKMKEIAYQYLKKYYSTQVAFCTIMRHFEK